MNEEDDDFKLLMISSCADVLRVTRLVYLKYRHHIHEDQVEELSRQIILLLLEDDFRRLRTFDSRKSSFVTWLNRVIEHYISHYLQSQKDDESLGDLLPDSLSYPPDQEANLITEEQRTILWSAIEGLPQRQKQLIRLVLEELPTGEIARRMDLKPESVYRSKHEIIRKLQRILGNGRGEHVPAMITGKPRNFQEGIKIFC